MFGRLIVNGFLDSEKFREIYAYLENAAKQVGVTLDMCTTADLLAPVHEPSPLLTPDFVLFWDKDTYLAQKLERGGQRLFNRARAIELCDNKCLTALALSDAVPTPRTLIAPKTFEGVGYTKRDFLSKAFDILGSPLIIKEAYGSFGSQVYLAHDFAEASAIVDRLGHKDFLMQAFIAESRGRDIRVNVVGDRVVSAMLRYNDGDFRSNITAGGSMKPFAVTKEIEAVSLAACRTLGLDFAGVDILLGKDGPIVCEVNSNPHFKSSYDCTGIDMSIDILEYICKTIK